MKKLTSLLLMVAMLFSLIACGGLDTDTIRDNLSDAGYTITSAQTDDMEILKDFAPKETIAATKLLDNIAVFLYDSEKDAKKAKEIYDKTLGIMGSVVKTGVKENAFYVATTDTVIEIAFKGA